MGKTMILVSHALDLIQSWCDVAVWLHEGTVKMHGEPAEVVDAYKKHMN